MLHYTVWNSFLGLWNWNSSFGTYGIGTYGYHRLLLFNYSGHVYLSTHSFADTLTTLIVYVTIFQFL